MMEDALICLKYSGEYHLSCVTGTQILMSANNLCISFCFPVMKGNVNRLDVAAIRIVCSNRDIISHIFD